MRAEAQRFELIPEEGSLLALIASGQNCPAETKFPTPPELNFQVRFVVYPAGGEIARYEHRPLQRHGESA